jgi:hypothetical protein
MTARGQVNRIERRTLRREHAHQYSLRDEKDAVPVSQPALGRTIAVRKRGQRQLEHHDGSAAFAQLREQGVES